MLFQTFITKHILWTNKPPKQQQQQNMKEQQLERQLALNSLL